MATVVSQIRPSDICSTIPDSTGSICSKLKALWSLANKMCTVFEQFLNEDGSLSDEGKSFLSGTAVPVGSVVFWPMDLAPDGWIRLDGSVVSRATYADLFAVYGIRYGAGDLTTTFQLPDMRRRFPFGSSGTNVAGSVGGNESVILSMPNLPPSPAPLGARMARLLGYPVAASTAVSDDVFPLFSGIATTVVGRKNDHADTDENVLGNLGIGTPVDIMPPYFSGMFIAKI